VIQMGKVCCVLKYQVVDCVPLILTFFLFCDFQLWSRPLQLSVSIETLALVFFSLEFMQCVFGYTVDIADLFQKPDPISCFVYFYQS
jgi:hypothetical protein